ncbi:MAG: alpha/beta hydrolase [Polyangia bacterium]|jgi:pimeloyl-ACP methyl ester carboxylesterase|nr:alpha/beta hydrolase [Polyangia bacterium]
MTRRNYEQEDFVSYDGTRIRMQRSGQGKPIVMANGLGGTFDAWRHVVSALGDRYRIVCWDYRGLYGSARPRDLSSLTVPNHCRDLEALLEREGIGEAVFMGWSMGTQVNFEFHRAHGSMMKGLILLNGTCGAPFDTALGIPGSKKIILAGLELMRRFPSLISKGTSLATGWSQLVPVLQQLGLVGQTLDLEVFGDLAGEFVKLDFEVYSATLRALGDHDACDVLSQVRCPTLLITGDRDVMTPVSTARHIKEQIADCELVVIPGATHYAAVEFPEEVVGAIEAFLRRIGY